MLAKVDEIMTKILQLAERNSTLNSSEETTEISDTNRPGVPVLDCEDLHNVYAGYYKLSFAVRCIVKGYSNSFSIQQTTVEDVVELIEEIAHNMLHYRVVQNVECDDNESFEKWLKRTLSEQGKQNDVLHVKMSGYFKILV